MKKRRSLTIVAIATAVVLAAIGANVWPGSVAPATKTLALQAEFPEQNLKELSRDSVYFVVPDYDGKNYCYFMLRREVSLVGEAKLYVRWPALMSSDGQSLTGKVQIISRKHQRFYNPTPERIQSYKFDEPKPWPTEFCRIA